MIDLNPTSLGLKASLRKLPQPHIFFMVYSTIPNTVVEFVYGALRSILSAVCCLLEKQFSIFSPVLDWEKQMPNAQLSHHFC